MRPPRLYGLCAALLLACGASFLAAVPAPLPQAPVDVTRINVPPLGDFAQADGLLAVLGGKLHNLSLNAFNNVVYARRKAKGDGVVLLDAKITTGQKTLTSASATFTAADVGKIVLVNEADGGNAGANGYTLGLFATIATFTDAHTVQLSVAATATVSPASRCVYGTDDTVALQSLVDTYLAYTDDMHQGNNSSGTVRPAGGTLHLGGGIYCLNGGIGLCNAAVGTVPVFGHGFTYCYHNITIQGAGKGATILQSMNPNANTGNFTFVGLVTIGTTGGAYQGNSAGVPQQCTNITVRDMTLYGTTYNLKKQWAVGLFAGDRCVFDNLELRGFDNEGIYAGGNSNTNTRVRDCDAYDCSLGGPVYNTGVSVFNLNGNDCFASGLRTYDCAIGIETGSVRLRVHNCYFDCRGFSNGGIGISSGSAVTGCYDVAVTGCTFRKVLSALQSNNTDGTIAEIEFSDNTVVDGGVSLAGGLESNLSGNSDPDIKVHGTSRVCNNRFVYSATFGPGAIVLGNQENFVVSGNTMQMNYTTGGATQFMGVGSFGVSAAHWQPVTAYVQSVTSPSFITPARVNGYVYRCTTSGTSGTTEPTWPTTIGNTVNDGTAVWTCYGLASIATIANNTIIGNTLLSQSNGEIQIQSGAERSAVRISNLLCVGYTGRITAPGWGDVLPDGFPTSDTVRYRTALPTAFSRHVAGERYLLPTPTSGAGNQGWLCTAQNTGILSAPWVKNTAYTYGTFIQGATGAGANHVFYCTTAGTSGATEPAWNVSGGTTADNTAAWLDVGLAAVFTAQP